MEFIIKLDIGQKYTSYQLNSIPIEVTAMKLKYLFPNINWIKLLEQNGLVQKTDDSRYLILKYPDDRFFAQLDTMFSLKQVK